MILLAQAVTLNLYTDLMARSHDLPDAAVKLLAWLCPAAGIDAAADGPMLVVQSMRQSHRLAITWDMVFDPATLMFLVGGLAWITIDAGRQNPIRQCWAAWGLAMVRFAAVVAAWLPVRAILVIALYLHRAATSETSLPLHVMNQFLSPWVLLTLLAPPILLAWRSVRLLGDVPVPAPVVPGSAGNRLKPELQSPELHTPAFFRANGSESLPVKYLAAAACCLFGAMLVALGLQWEPVGARKTGRVMVVEKHSPWSPTDVPFNTEVIGGGDDEHGTSYNYAGAYQYLGQYFDMKRLGERDTIDDATLAGCDVLVIKIPRFRYTPEEAGAVIRFVEGGGGLLLIGDHTNLECSSAFMNDITRAFGFTFRDDVLYSVQPSPDQEHYRAPLTPHPAIMHVPEFDFAVSCSIDPGTSQGRPVVAATGLWSMPSDYHMANYMYYAQHLPEMRFGGFIQAWSTHAGRGRDRLGRLDHLLKLLPLPARQGPGTAEHGRVAQSPRGSGPVVALDRAGAGGGGQRAVAGSPRRLGLVGAGGGGGLRLDRRFGGHGSAFRSRNADAVSARRTSNAASGHRSNHLAGAIGQRPGQR